MDRGNVRQSNSDLSGPMLALQPWDSLKSEFIVVDGMDAAGKTTTIAAVAAALKGEGRPFIQTKSPTDFIRKLPLYEQYLLHPDARERISYQAIIAMISGDRLQHAHEVIKPAAASGSSVLCDRYVYSALAHCLARQGMVEDWTRLVLSLLPAPTRAVVLTADMDVIRGRLSERGARSREGFLEAGFIDRLHEAYLVVAQNEGVRVLDTGTIGIDDIVAAILE